MTAGLDLGDKYSYLCLLDDESGEVIEEGRLRTTPEVFKRRFGSERPLKTRKAEGLTTAAQKRLRRQTEQLQRNVGCVRSMSASNRTVPQWHEP